MYPENCTRIVFQNSLMEHDLLFRNLAFLFNHRFHSKAIASIFQRGCNLKGICRAIHDVHSSLRYLNKLLNREGGSTFFHKLLESLHSRKRWMLFSDCKSQHVHSTGNPFLSKLSEIRTRFLDTDQANKLQDQFELHKLFSCSCSYRPIYPVFRILYAE